MSHSPFRATHLSEPLTYHLRYSMALKNRSTSLMQAAYAYLVSAPLNTRCLLAFQSPGMVADRLMLFRIAGTGLENMQRTPAALLLVPGVPTTTSNQYVLV
jgi:hypothetical protein